LVRPTVLPYRLPHMFIRR